SAWPRCRCRCSASTPTSAARWSGSRSASATRCSPKRCRGWPGCRRRCDRRRARSRGGGIVRAYRFTALGGPEVEAFLDVPEPTPGEGELLVRVRAAGVNPGDWRLREGSYGPVAPAVLGREVAGTVAALGAGVSGFAVGDEVFGGCPNMQGGFAPLARVT